ncbi:unnamed protein product, partial [Meganyctiphanes norvegica]
HGNESFWVGGSTVSGGIGWMWVDGSPLLHNAPLWHVNSNGLPIRVQQHDITPRQSRQKQRKFKPDITTSTSWRSRQNRAKKRFRGKSEFTQLREWRIINTDREQSQGRILPGAGACMIPKLGHVLAACPFTRRLSYICAITL